MPSITNKDIDLTDTLEFWFKDSEEASCSQDSAGKCKTALYKTLYILEDSIDKWRALPYTEDFFAFSMILQVNERC
jgi:hypothetical protein